MTSDKDSVKTDMFSLKKLLVKLLSTESPCQSRGQLIKPMAMVHYSMMTSSNGDIFCVGNLPVIGDFPSQRPVTQSFDFSLIYVWTNSWVNHRDAGDLRCHCIHYDVTVMLACKWEWHSLSSIHHNASHRQCWLIVNWTLKWILILYAISFPPRKCIWTYIVYLSSLGILLFK